MTYARYASYAWSAVVLAVLGLFVGVAPAHAQIPLAPGDTVSLPGTNATDHPELVGQILDTAVFSFEIFDPTNPESVLVSGTVLNSVIRSDMDGTLDFYYRVLTDAERGPGEVAALSSTSFTGFTTAVDYRTDSEGDVNPVSATRTSDGGEVRFDFEGTALSSGATSRDFFIKTNAINYGVGGQTIMLTSGGLGVALDGTFQPVPAPSALVTVILGALPGLCVVLRIRRQVRAG